MQYHMYDIQTAGSQIEDASKVLMIYTGGTLGMTFDNEHKTLVPIRFEKIRQNIPEMARFEGKLSILPLEPPIDSSDMTPATWIELAVIIEEHYVAFDAFVILHGTDTMAYTASALSFLLENLAKPVLLTGAQLPIGLPRTDARENIMTTLELAADRQNGKSVLLEVCIYFNGRLLRGNRAKKYESSQFDAFQSENYPMLAEVGVYCDYNKPYLLPKPKSPLRVHEKMDRQVVVLKLFPGINNEMVAHILQQKQLKAVVLETFGSGNASSDKVFLTLLKEATERGLLIYNVSQCSGGAVRQADYATGKGLATAGVISGRDITTEAALTKLMYLLGREYFTAEIKVLLEKNLRGEMSD